MNLANKLRQITDETLRLMAIVEVGKLLNSTLDLREILGIILETATKNLHADRGTVYIIDKKRNELWSKVKQGDSHVEIRLPIGQGIAGYVAETGQRIMLKDAYKDPRFNPEFDKKTGYRTKTMLCTPMKNRDGEMIGVFQIINKLEKPSRRKDDEDDSPGGHFSMADVKFLDVLSVDACIAIENARLHEESIEKERLEKELEVAATIQKMIIPKTIRQVDGFEISGVNIPSRQVGGDFYDVVHLSNGKIALVIADVSGKSVPGALLVSTLQASLRAYLEFDLDIKSLVSKLNKIIYQNSTTDKYITFFMGILDPGSRRVRSVNAGHNPPYLLRNGELTTLKVGGIPLGMADFDMYESEEIEMQPGDILVMFTDGVTEAANKSEDMYDEGRLEELIKNHPRASAGELQARLLEDLQKFVGEADQADDITMLIVKAI